jgi:t-SNARE complex subunit (syntaxin)
VPVGGASLVDLEVGAAVEEALVGVDPAGFSAASFSGAAVRSVESRAATYHRARARLREAEAVESSLTSLGAMFSRVADLVAEQGETWQTVAANIDSAADNAMQAEALLAKYLTAVSSDRRIILTVLAVIVTVALLVLLVR